MRMFMVARYSSLCLCVCFLYHVHSALCVHLVELIVINFALVDVQY